MSTCILSAAHVPRRTHEIPHLPERRPCDWLRRGLGDLVAMPGVSPACGAPVPQPTATTVAANTL